jgi:hypothetical protein
MCCIDRLNPPLIAVSRRGLLTGLLCAAIEPSCGALIRLTTAARKRDSRCLIDARSDSVYSEISKASSPRWLGISRSTRASDGERQLHRTKVSRPQVNHRSPSLPHRVSSGIGRSSPNYPTQPLRIRRTAGCQGAASSAFGSGTKSHTSELRTQPSRSRQPFQELEPSLPRA